MKYETTPRKTALDRLSLDDFMYVRQMVQAAIDADFPFNDDRADEIDWLIQRGAENFDADRLLCILLISFKTAVVESGDIKGVLAMMDSFCDPDQYEFEPVPEPPRPTGVMRNRDQRR
jgi:hypothetical protein